MPRQRSPDRDKAKELYLQCNGKIPLTEIADRLNLSEGTVRGWKTKDNWDGVLNGTLRTTSKKNTERSKRNTERSAPNENNPSNKNTKIISSSKYTESDAEGSITKNRGAPFGNKNALGNRGGPGAPEGNQRAFKTGEYAVITMNNLMDAEEIAIINQGYTRYDIIFEQIDIERLRVHRILKLIKETKETPGGMVFRSVSKSKGTLSTNFTNRNKDGETRSGNEMAQGQENTTHIAIPVAVRVMELEEALTRVNRGLRQALQQLHRMLIEDERLGMDKAKLELYRQKLIGQFDPNDLVDSDDLGIDFDFTE